jgi:hypothetical protein
MCLPSSPLLGKERRQCSRSAAFDYDKGRTTALSTQPPVPVRLNFRAHSSTFSLFAFAVLDDAMRRATYAGPFVYVLRCIERGKRDHNSAPLGGADYAF